MRRWHLHLLCQWLVWVVLVAHSARAGDVAEHGGIKCPWVPWAVVGTDSGKATIQLLPGSAGLEVVAGRRNSLLIRPLYTKQVLVQLRIAHPHT